MSMAAHLVGQAKVHFTDDEGKPIVLEGTTSVGTMGNDAYVEIIHDKEHKFLPMNKITYIEWTKEPDRSHDGIHWRVERHFCFADVVR